MLENYPFIEPQYQIFRKYAKIGAVLEATVVDTNSLYCQWLWQMDHGSGVWNRWGTSWR